MTTMTIHAEDAFAEALRLRARETGTSINQFVKDTLAPILGLAKKHDAENPFLKFCGVLPKGERKRMDDAIIAQRTIDKEIWR